MNVILTIPDFGPDLLGAIARKLNVGLQKSLLGIKQGTQEAVEKAVRSSPEYFSLLRGRLWHELGLPDPPLFLEKLIETLQSDVHVDLSLLKVRGGKFDGGLSIGILRSDYASILNLPIAQFRSEGGFSIDWLRWLLGSGPYLINAEYRFVPGPNNASRTGSGVMSRGGSWGVPPQFAGTYQDNWLTRALGTLEEPVSKVIQRELKKAL